MDESNSPQNTPVPEGDPIKEYLKEHPDKAAALEAVLNPSVDKKEEEPEENPLAGLLQNSPVQTQTEEKPVENPLAEYGIPAPIEPTKEKGKTANSVSVYKLITAGILGLFLVIFIFAILRLLSL